MTRCAPPGCLHGPENVGISYKCPIARNRVNHRIAQRRPIWRNWHRACVKHGMQRLLVLTLLVFVAAPASAGGGTPIPEPSHLALFALGVIGVILGRAGARKRRDRDED